MIFLLIRPALQQHGSVAGWMTALLLAAGASHTAGQVVLDGKFGTAGALAGPNYAVAAGQGATRGNNLFHSFAQFDLKAGDVAAFSGPANIQNILTRVTGGSPSSINGTIRSDIAGANFFLINPNGVLFGPNAAVNVSGSFAASTADYLKLADDARFVAALDADDSGLSTAPVSAFGFLGENPGSIEGQQSPLRVSSGKTITLVGGSVALDGGTVQAPGGQLNLVSVHSAGEVPANPTTLSPAEFQSMFPKQGEVTLQNRALLDANGAGGGRIVIRSGQLTVDNSTIQANTTSTAAGQGIDIAVVNDLELVHGGQINSLSTLGRGAGGNINLSADSIRLDGGGLVGADFNPTTRISTASGTPSATTGTAKGGDIVIRANSLELLNSAQITSSTFGGGDAGRIEITASSVRLDAQITKIAEISVNTWKTFGGGNAGDIAIRTDTLDMLNGATILAITAGSGNAGLIDVDAQDVNILSGAIMTAGTFGAGNGGNIQIVCDSMRIDGQSPFADGLGFLTGIQAVTTWQNSPAPGGSIHITADTLDLEHMGSIFTTSYGSGPGGSIELTAGKLNLAIGSTIQAAAQANGPAGLIEISAQSINLLSGGIITASTSGAGNGGNIQITAETISINGQDALTGDQDSLTGIQAVTKSSDSPAAGGSVQITADSINLDHLASVSTTSYGLGPGGVIEVTAGNLILDNSSSIRAAGEASGRAGNISLHATKNVVLTDSSAVSTFAKGSSGGDIFVQAGSEIRLADSQITAQAGLDGGNITLLAPSLIYLLGSKLTAEAVGDGGNLIVGNGTIDPEFFIINNSDLISKSTTANGGNITILSDYFFQSESTIDASGALRAGNVIVSAPEVDLSGSLIGLPSNLLGAETQLRPDCGVRLTEDLSSFIVLGRGGLPIEPGGFVPSGAAPTFDETR